VSLRGFLVGALCLALAWLAWNAPEAKRWAGPWRSAVMATLQRPQAPLLQPADQAHKCVTASGVLYTREACPRGSREQAITGGSVNVVPAQAAARPVEAASATPLLRTLVPDGGELKDKQMQRIIDEVK